MTEEELEEIIEKAKVINRKSNCLQTVPGCKLSQEELEKIIEQARVYNEYSNELIYSDDVDEEAYEEDSEEEISREPMVLLKMTCPSTGHIHILRVPPEMTRAEAAITWVNHGIHPDEFSVQT